ncbi:MAG: phosphate acyltransferase PlsX, partial [Calditrichia bacterium]
MDLNRIVIDAMGGDHAPGEIVKGTLLALRENPHIKCILVGDEDQIQPLLSRENFDRERLEIHHTGEYITMDEPPKKAVLAKPEASVNIAAQIATKGEADAMVSAGNTGATIISCSQFIPRIPGVERAGLAAVFPAYKQKREDPGRSIMLDVGATLHCSTNQLVSFAIMGSHYAREVMQIQNPRVGLLNIGEEETKGHSTLIATNTKLQHCELINFIGNIEGKDILRGTADVIVTEGLVGNVALKAIEGLAEMTIDTMKRIWKKNLIYKLGLLLPMPVLKKLKRRIDYTEYGGAPIMGFEKLVIKAHGRSNAKAIKNAILMANTAIENDVVEHMRNSIRDFL